MVNDPSRPTLPSSAGCAELRGLRSSAGAPTVLAPNALSSPGAPNVSDYLKIALVALVAIVVAKKVLPMVPGGDAIAAQL